MIFYAECHAEFNALMSTSDVDVKGCTLYSTTYPCNDCFKLALEAGITGIIHLEGPKTDGRGEIIAAHRATEKMLMSLPALSAFCRQIIKKYFWYSTFAGYFIQQVQ